MPTSHDKKKYAPTVWGGGSSAKDAKGPVEVVCPSGQTCLAQRPGLEMMLRSGLLKDYNALAGAVGIKIDAKKNPQKAAKNIKGSLTMEKLFEKPEMIDNMMRMMDKVVCEVVVEPEVAMAPNDPTSRKDDVIYTDMIDLEDRMFLFNWAMGGSSDLDRFRTGLHANVASLANEQGMEEASE